MYNWNRQFFFFLFGGGLYRRTTETDKWSLKRWISTAPNERGLKGVQLVKQYFYNKGNPPPLHMAGGNNWKLYRHGNCLWKCKFLGHWKKLSGEKKLSAGKRHWEYKKKRGSTGFSSALKTRETYRVRSHVAIARLSHSIDDFQK